MPEQKGAAMARHNTHSSDPIGSWSIKEGLDEILRKSCHLMAKKGFHGTSMRDLAQATGRSLSGLYHYFRSKEDLLFLINLHGFRTLNDTWSKLREAFHAPQERLYAFVFFHMSYFAEHMDEMRVMVWGTQVMSLEKARMIQKLKDRYTASAREIVKDVCEKTNGGDLDQTRLERETYLLFGMMNWTFSWYAPRRHGNVSVLVADVFETFTSGISGQRYDRDQLEQMRTAVDASFRQSKASSMWTVAEKQNKPKERAG